MHNVLLIEDDVSMRNALKSIISSKGEFNITSASGNIEDVGNICNEHVPDIVFLDSVLYGLNSIEIASLVKNDYKNTTIYIISAFKSDPFIKEFLRLGVDDYITIPLTFSKVYSLLEKYLVKGNIFGDNSRIKSVVEMLTQKNYPNIYAVSAELVNRFKNEDEGAFQENIISIAKSVHHTVEITYNMDSNFDAQYVVEESLYSNPIYWIFWLIDFIDRAFQLVAINECQILDAVFNTINTSMNEPVALDQITRKSNISAGYLNKKIRASFGVSTMEYIQRKKINEAKRIIALSNSKFGDIAYNLGYYESSYFTKVFKKIEGCTPLEYRRQISDYI